jgi:TolB-like protein/DNA-binding SARP family transcriptional activator
MTGRITINILGPFEALGPRGENLVVHSRRSRALLSCLAMETGESWTRSRLATLLWHDRSEQQGRSSLRQELVQLRRDLGVTAPVDWGRAPFVWLPKQMLTDVARFRAAVAGGDALRAASIWRGELLQATDLPAGPFAEWLALSGSRLREAAVACFARALREAGSDNDPLPLEGVASKLVGLDPGNEEAHRFLMRSSASRHDLAELIERYRRYVMTAGRGTGGDPSVAMKRFLDEMIAQSSRQRKLSPSGFSTRRIAEINRQHHSAAAPDPTHLSPIENAAALAVIPFVDLSPGAASKAALADGLTEELTTAMARLPGLFVTARQSAMVYRMAKVDARTIASDLGVRYLMEGSIEVRGKIVRVNARLIDGRSGLHLWANNYEDRFTEFFSVRNQIVSTVASQLQPALMVADLDRALDAGPNNLDAWTRLQRANAHVLFKRSAQSLASAVNELKQALAIDPDYAMAQSLLAAVYTWRATWSTSARTPAERALALDYAARARKTDPDNPFVLINCADTAIYSAGDIDLGLELLNHAVERNPHDPQGLALLANANRVAGADAAGSLRMIRQAMRISPRDPRSHRWLHYAGWCHWKLGELEKMEAAASNAIELYSDAPAQWIELTCALGLQGKTNEAKAAAKVIRKLSPAFTADRFYEIAQQFYGKRFTGSVKTDYQALCSTLRRAM